jgi:hypothetical protein
MRILQVDARVELGGEYTKFADLKDSVEQRMELVQEE